MFALKDITEIEFLCGYKQSFNLESESIRHDQQKTVKLIVQNKVNISIKKKVKLSRGKKEPKSSNDALALDGNLQSLPQINPRQYQGTT